MSAGRDEIARHLADDIPPNLLETMLRSIPDDANLDAGEDIVRSLLKVSAP